MTFKRTLTNGYDICNYCNKLTNDIVQQIHISKNKINFMCRSCVTMQRLTALDEFLGNINTILEKNVR